MRRLVLQSLTTKQHLQIISTLAHLLVQTRLEHYQRILHGLVAVARHIIKVFYQTQTMLTI